MWMTKILKFCVENSKITENVMPLRELNMLVKICILTRFFLVNLWLTIDFLKTFLKIVFGVFNVHKSLWFYNDYFYILIKIKLVFSFLFFFLLIIFFQLVKKSEYYRAGCVYYYKYNHTKTRLPSVYQWYPLCGVRSSPESVLAHCIWVIIFL